MSHSLAPRPVRLFVYSIVVTIALVASVGLSAQPNVNWNLTNTNDTQIQRVDCVGTTSYPTPNPGNACQSYAVDVYENWDANVAGAGDTDIWVIRAGHDSTFLYAEFETRLTWNHDNTGTSRGYHIELDTNPSVESPGRFDYFFIYTPDATHDDNNVWDAEGNGKVKAYLDANNDMGGSNVAISNFTTGTRGNGYETDVTLAANATYVRIITRGGKKIVQLAIRGTVVGSPTEVRGRFWLTQTSTLDKSKKAWHDHNASTDLTSVRMDNLGGSEPVGGVPFGPGVTSLASVVEFDAVETDGDVAVSWRTDYEVDNVGFNVYRESGSHRALVNPAPVLGSAFIAAERTELTSGFSYTWIDSAPRQGAVYWLESIDLDGTKAMHGPIVPVGSFYPRSPRISSERSRTFGEVGTVAGPVQTRMVGERSLTEELSRIGTQLARTKQFEIASSNAAKLTISTDGIYRVSKAALLGAGFDPGTSSAALKLYADGKEIAIAVRDGGDGRFDSSDFIEFYAVRLDTASAGSRVYWLLSSGSVGKRLGMPAKTNATVSADSWYTHTLERKDRVMHFAAFAPKGREDGFYGPMVYQAPTVQAFELRNLEVSGRTARVELSLQGIVDGADHAVRVDVNGLAAGTLTFKGIELGKAAFDIPAASLRDGTNQVTLTAIGGASDFSLIDYVRLSYPHKFVADDDNLTFLAKGRTTVTVRGFSTPEIRALDVTDRFAPIEVDAAVKVGPNGYELIVAPHEKGTRVILASTRFLQPAAISRNEPSFLSSEKTEADFVVITHPSLATAIQPLVERRRAEGFKVAVASVDDVYDEFGFGSKDPQAIRDFLDFASRRWRKAPKHVLLVGDASFDPRNYVGSGASDLVPTRMVSTRYLVSASDDWFVDFNDDLVPDMYIGRIPAGNASEAHTVVAKILGYDPAVRRGVLFVADKDDSVYSFERATADASAVVPATLGNVRKLLLSQAADPKSAFVSEINAGASVVSFMGHASVGVIGKSQFFKTSDVSLLANPPAAFVLMDCFNALFHGAQSSMAESLLESPSGGAMAVWGSTAMTFPAYQAELHVALYRLLGSNRSMTFGEAATRAKAAVGDPDVRRTWVLLGDPTARLGN